ncbi:MAG: hypothetical protein ABIO96_06195 [Nitrospiraceae bacterium]
MTYLLTGKREKFCQLVATGATYTDAYLEAYQKPTEYNRKLAAEAGSRLMADTDIILRVQDLQQPVLRKVRRKIEFQIQHAYEQCQRSFDLACAQSDVNGMLAATKLQAELSKLLTQQIDVNHRHGMLDEESTEVLLAIRDAVMVRKAKQKALMEKAVEKIETIEATPHRPPFAPRPMVPSSGYHREGHK